VRALRYSLGEAVASLSRGWRSSALSVATIATAMVVLGVLLLVSSNLQRVLGQWAVAVEMSVYLHDDATDAARASVGQILEESVLVAEHVFVSKEEALTRFQEDFADLVEGTDSADSNPFSASVEVRLAPDFWDSAAFDQLASVVRGATGVADVRFDDRGIEQIATRVTFLRGAGMVLALVLVVAAALTVINVIRLACFTRQEEVEIMQLVGAPLTYVRGPFVMEGVLQGGIGAMAALVVLGVGFMIGDRLYGETAATVLGVDAVQFLPPILSLLLVFGGMAVGGVGGLVAARSTRNFE